MKVKNLNETSPNKCNCNSWLDHWLKFSRQNASGCCVIGCRNKPSVGGHVQKDSIFGGNWYVIPLCARCNNKKGKELNIWDGVSLVSANVGETCGKSQ